MIHAKLKNSGRYYEAEGETALDAVLNLKIENPKGISILTIIDGKKEKVKILKPFILNSLFGKASQMRKDIALKQLSVLF